MIIHGDTNDKTKNSPFQNTRNNEFVILCSLHRICRIRTVFCVDMASACRVLLGAGVYASHGYERSHVEGVKNTFDLLAAYVVL